VVRGPGELHKAAIGAFMEDRRANPDHKDLGDDENPIFHSAREYAIKRFSTKSDESLKVQRPQIGAATGDTDSLLALPSPEEDHASVLAAAITTTSLSTTDSFASSPAEIASLSVAVSEDIGMGAISKYGGLPMGENHEWVKFVEDKLKRDNKLPHQKLMSELGSSVLEEQQREAGGLNLTLEEELLQNVTNWFTAGGGVLKYVTPAVTAENGLTLVAAEDIGQEDVVVSIPIKLTMCRISARNVLIPKKSKYLGAELKKTFENDEAWGLTIFVLHEWYKETAGRGSKWGPYLRTLRMRSLSTPTVQGLEGTRAIELMKQWMKSSDDLRFFSSGSDGPCSPVSGICDKKPNDKFSGHSRFEDEEIRWAYWVVMQNAVQIHQVSTGQSFLALVPFYNMVAKRIGSGGGVSFNLDGSVTISVGSPHEEGEVVGVHPGNFSDHEFYMRYLSAPRVTNPNNYISMPLPGALPHGSEYHVCLHMSQELKDKKGKCRKETSDLMWKMKTLTEWRKMMNLPPRVGELRMWATRLHLYGDDDEEQKRLSSTNQLLAGLPVSTDEIPAEDQLMLMGRAESNEQAMAMVANGRERPVPQLYEAPNPEEDPEAQRGMEHLATLAAQVQMVIGSGNLGLNATRAVLNKTRDFFQNGVLPSGGLDELDDFIMKKIGMLTHCGTDRQMKILHGNISKELMCGMRVHLMNESEMNVFCPAESKAFSANCQDVLFMNYTAISMENELNVVETFQNTVSNLLHTYPTTLEEDEILLKEKEDIDSDGYGPVFLGAIRLRMREKQLLLSTLQYLEDHKNDTLTGKVPFQIELKRLEREEADLRSIERQELIDAIEKRSDEKRSLAYVPVDVGVDKPKLNLTLLEGHDIKETVLAFCRSNGIPASYVSTLENSLRKQVKNPPALRLLLRVVTPYGISKVIGIPEGLNETVEVAVFCAENGYHDQDDCDEVQSMVQKRLMPANYSREIIGLLSVDAPDSRKLKMVLRQGEQHDLLQFTRDFLEYYKMSNPQSIEAVANAMHQRLPATQLQLPVSLTAERRVGIRLASGENISAVIQGFMDVYDVPQEMSVKLLRMAMDGMNPGSFVVPLPDLL